MKKFSSGSRSLLAGLAGLLGLWWGTLGAMAAATPDPGDYVAALKQFLGTNYAEYEVVYSIIEHKTDAAVRLLAGINASWSNSNPGMQISMGFEHPSYHRVRRTPEGYLEQRGTDPEELRTLRISGPTSYAHGVISNQFWQLDQGVFHTDDGYLTKLKQDRGLTWQDEADETVNRILSFGMPIEKDSLVWQGNNFTAQLRDPGQKSAQFHAVSGRLVVSNEMPVALEYTAGDFRFDIQLTYESPLREILRIPSIFDIYSKTATQAFSHTTVHLMSFVTPHFTAADLSPHLFTDPVINPRLTVFHQLSNGTQKTLQIAGQSLRRQPPTGPAAPAGETRSVRLRKWIGAVILVASFYVGLRWIILRRTYK